MNLSHSFNSMSESSRSEHPLVHKSPPIGDIFDTSTDTGIQLPTYYGDITDNVGKYTIICNYCDCVSKSATGTTGKVFDKYPMANVYKKSHSRSFLSVPGTISVHDCGSVWVINMYAQTGPGKPLYSEIPAVRRLWLSECLNSLTEYLHAGSEPIIGKADNIRYTIIFPYGMGCGATAGNEWSSIKPMLELFARDNKEYADVQIMADIIVMLTPSTESAMLASPTHSRSSSKW